MNLNLNYQFATITFPAFVDMDERLQSDHGLNDMGAGDHHADGAVCSGATVRDALLCLCRAGGGPDDPFCCRAGAAIVFPLTHLSIEVQGILQAHQVSTKRTSLATKQPQHPCTSRALQLLPPLAGHGLKAVCSG